MSLTDLVEQAVSGSHRALGRVSTILDRQGDEAAEVRRALRGRDRRAQIVGITGPPGAGKSSLLAAVAEKIAAAEKSVAVIAVDPTSPLTGGATLGDRIRMTGVAVDPRVFIRSIASRTRTDGLSPAVLDLVRLYDAAGFDYVFVETVGSGQNQVEIAHRVHTVVLVQAPGAGDSVQMMKAGIMELANIYAVSKADQPGAHLISRELRAMLNMAGTEGDSWRPPVVLCSMESGEGIADLLAAIDEHARFLRESNHLEGRDLRAARAETVEALVRLADEAIGLHPELLDGVATGSVTPDEAAARIVSALENSHVN